MQVRDSQDWGLQQPVKPCLSLPPTHHRILYTTYFESTVNLGTFFGYYFLNILLMILQLLHVFWSCLILRMIYSFIKKGQVGSLVVKTPCCPCRGRRFSPWSGELRSPGRCSRPKKKKKLANKFKKERKTR